MKLSLFGRWSMALFASMVLGLGMTACGGGTIGYMWVLGQQYNQIDGFKIDDYSGNLTEVPNAPFSTNGLVPVSIVVKSGGRYVYVVNQGTGGSAAGRGTGQTVSLFSVGGDGTLTFQQAYQTQGYVSQWAQMDSSGSYLYVLDKYSPGLDSNDNLYDGPNLDGLGSVTVFASDASTGRLTLITNAQTKINGINLPFVEVGASPFMMKSIAGCLYTLDAADQSVFALAVGTGGQLLNVTTGGIFLPQTVNMTSINGNGSYLFITDAGANQIVSLQSTGTCNLSALNGGKRNNTTGATMPMYSLLDARSSYLYVLNQSTTNTQTNMPFSSISAFTLNQSTNELTEIAAGQTFPVGSNPVCIVEDPSSQYLYISNHNDGTITGKQYDPNTGEISNLKRGSTFPTVGQTGCLVVSGAID